MPILVTNQITRSEIDPERYVAVTASAEGSFDYAWGMTCDAEGCEAHCFIARPDGGLIADSRARELSLLNGWSRLGFGRYACPLHTITSEPTEK